MIVWVWLQHDKMNITKQQFGWWHMCFWKMKLYFHLCLLILVTPQRLVLKLSREQLWRAAFLLFFAIFYSCEGQNWKTTGKTQEGQRKSQGSKVSGFLLVNFCVFWFCITIGMYLKTFIGFTCLSLIFISSQKVSMGDVVARLAINSPIMAAV